MELTEKEIEEILNEHWLDDDDDFDGAGAARAIHERVQEGVVWEGKLRASHFTTGAEMDIYQTDLGGMHISRLDVDDGERVQVTVRRKRDV